MLRYLPKIVNSLKLAHSPFIVRALHSTSKPPSFSRQPLLPPGVEAKLNQIGEEAGWTGWSASFQPPGVTTQTAVVGCILECQYNAVDDNQEITRDAEANPIVLSESIGMGFGRDEKEALFNAVQMFINRQDEGAELVDLRQQNEELKRKIFEKVEE